MAVAKAFPPIAVSGLTLAGVQLQDWLIMTTLLYTVIQIIIALPKLKLKMDEVPCIRLDGLELSAEKGLHHCSDNKLAPRIQGDDILKVEMRGYSFGFGSESNGFGHY